MMIFKQMVEDRCASVKDDLEKYLAEYEKEKDGDEPESSRPFFGSLPNNIRKVCFGRDIKAQLLLVYGIQNSIVDRVNATRYIDVYIYIYVCVCIDRNSVRLVFQD
mgnify:CR=1 FL=1|tara:strand:- start:1127 stop:1444 length:318 start_codon:yes stop_codon:yes gene_type:complete